MSRVCLVCVSLRAGGTERIVSRIANRLIKRHQVKVLLMSHSVPFYQLAPTVEVSRPALDARSEAGWYWYPRIIGHLSRGLKEFRPELILCFGETIAPFVLLMAAPRGFRVIVFNRASPFASLSGVRGVLNPLTYPLAHKVVVQTQRAADMMCRRYVLSRFSVLPNPVEIPTHVPPLEGRTRRIINVGTLGGQKNQEALIYAFSRLESREGWELILVGDGPDRGRLEKMVERVGLKNSVRFLGEREDVGQLLQDSRIFAFSSRTEGFPNALAEALAAGCACVSYDCATGPSEMIQDRVSGLIVPNGDDDGFKQALQELTLDSELRVRLGRAGRKGIWQFETEHFFEELDQLIEEALPYINPSQKRF